MWCGKGAGWEARLCAEAAFVPSLARVCAIARTVRAPPGRSSAPLAFPTVNPFWCGGFVSARRALNSQPRGAGAGGKDLNIQLRIQLPIQPSI